MLIKHKATFFLFLSSLYVFPTLAQAFDLTEDGKWKLKTLLRMRFETDWQVYRANNKVRPDRDRLRIAANTELQYYPTKEWSLGLRVAIANDNRNSNGNVTVLDFQNNPKGGRDVYLDRWFVKFNGDHWWMWTGRNVVPIWMQNDYFWDAISAPAGLAFGGSTDYQQHHLSLFLGHFATPDGKYWFNGQFTSIQGMDVIKDEDSTTTAALGLFIFHGHKGGFRNNEGDGSRDYKILMTNLQYVNSLWDIPITFGADAYCNVEPYSAQSSDKYTAAHHNEVLGAALSVKYGNNQKSGDWLLSYAYAYIEALAVNGDFAQSDWARFDPSGSDVKGHDIRVNYMLSKYFWLSSRVMLVERISDQERGNRFRLDFNFNF